MDNFLLYNGFGFLSVSPDKVRVTLTAVRGEREISRTVEKELEERLDLEDTCNFALGVYMQPGKASRITVRELSAPIDKNIFSFSIVKETVKKAIDLIRISAEPV